jgi:hypothetical protein
VVRHLHHLAREGGRVARGLSPRHHRLRWHLLTAFWATLVIDLIGTAVVYAFEHDKPGSDIHSYFESFFWVTTQLLTVSSQMANPVTTGGRIIDIFLELWAISIVAATAGAFAAFLHERPPGRET